MTEDFAISWFRIIEDIFVTARNVVLENKGSTEVLLCI